MTDDPSRLKYRLSVGYHAPIRPRVLDDRDWLATRYALAGDRIIARELGCAPLTVIRARQRLGIASHRPGARGITTGIEPDRAAATTLDMDESLAALSERFDEDQRHRAPATRDLLIARCKGWLEAERHHDHLAIEDALLSIASAALLIHQHQRTSASAAAARLQS